MDGYDSGLHRKMTGYLEASGYRTVRSSPGFIDAYRPSQGSAGERLLVWTGERSEQPGEPAGRDERLRREAYESSVLGRMRRELNAAEGARGFYLVERRRGLSQHFISEATRLLAKRGGGVRVPIEFFDSPYKHESGDAEKARRARRARSTLDQILSNNAAFRRVSQPFRLRTGPDLDTVLRQPGDLVTHLQTEDFASRPNVRIIDGSAGGGKSVAFAGLAASLYRQFVTAKAERRQRPRPVVFLPEHLRGNKLGYVDDVIGAVADTDIAGVAPVGAMKWLLHHGHAVWMFDGLDEFYAGSPDFLAFIEGMLNAPGSRAQFVIATRDSLLTASSALRTFVARQKRQGERVDVYELSAWSEASWRQMATLELDDGQSGARRPSRADAFVEGLSRSKELAELAGLPFYCSILLQRFASEGALPADDIELLDYAVGRMIEREQGKGTFQWHDFLDIDGLRNVILDESDRLEGLDWAHFDQPDLAESVDGLLAREGRDSVLDFFGVVAHRHRRAPDEAGCSSLALERVRAISGSSFISSTLDTEDALRLMTVIVQFAFFGRGDAAGSVGFTQHIVADYLAARHAVGMLRRGSKAWTNGQAGAALPHDVLRQAIGTTGLSEDSLFYRYLLREIARDPGLQAFVEAARRGGVHRLSIAVPSAPLHATRRHVASSHRLDFSLD